MNDVDLERMGEPDYMRPILVSRPLGETHWRFACPECGKPQQIYEYTHERGSCSACGSKFDAVGTWPAGDRTRDIWVYLRRVRE